MRLGGGEGRPSSNQTKWSVGNLRWSQKCKHNLWQFKINLHLDLYTTQYISHALQSLMTSSPALKTHKSIIITTVICLSTTESWLSLEKVIIIHF